MVTVNPSKIKGSSLLYPILTFLGSGLIDTSLKYLQTKYVNTNDISVFSATVFGAAGITGLLLFLFQIIQGDFKFQLKNLVGGVVLGIVNYFSIYYLVRAIGYKGLESSTFFIINNVGILLVTTILGLIFFSEKLSSQIVLVSFSGSF